MGSRLRQAREKANFKSARSAAIKFGWTPSTYAAHENGQNEFSPEVASAYARALRTSPSWLLTGEGDPGPRKRNLVPSFDPDAPDTSPDPDSPAPADNFPPDAIKELLTRPGMGGGQTIATTYVRKDGEVVLQDDVADDYWRLPPEFVRSILGARPIDLLVMKGNGDSMQPTIMSGEPVIVNTAHRKPSPDGLYAIRDQLGEAVIKRLELFGTDPPRVRIISDNPKHTPQERGLDEIKIIGKVLLGLKLF